MVLNPRRARRLGRTFIQVVQRSSEGPIGQGIVLVENVGVEDCGLADGGSCLTLAGHADTTIYRNVTVRGGYDATLDALPARGAIVAWTPGGTNYWEDIYQNGTVIIEDCAFDFQQGDRALASFAGAERLEITGTTFHSAVGKDVHFDPKGTGSVQNNAPEGIVACDNVVTGVEVFCMDGACPFDITAPCE